MALLLDPPLKFAVKSFKAVTTASLKQRVKIHYPVFVIFIMQTFIKYPILKI